MYPEDAHTVYSLYINDTGMEGAGVYSASTLEQKDGKGTTHLLS